MNIISEFGTQATKVQTCFRTKYGQLQDTGHHAACIMWGILMWGLHQFLWYKQRLKFKSRYCSEIDITVCQGYMSLK